MSSDLPLPLRMPEDAGPVGLTNQRWKWTSSDSCEQFNEMRTEVLLSAALAHGGVACSLSKVVINISC